MRGQTSPTFPLKMRSILLLAVLSAACVNSRDAAAGKTRLSADSTAKSVIGASVANAQPAPAPATGGIPAEVMKLRTDPEAPIRGLYVNRFAAQSTKKMKKLLAIADSTEINAFVIDIKDEFGLNYNSSDPMLQKNAGTQTKVRDLKALVDTINAHGILPIARIVVFKDSVTARMNPQHTIRKADGTPWRDHKGLTWVNPYAQAIWEYNFRIAEEAVKMGFGEVQFDYIRFPEPYKSLPPQVFPGGDNRPKPDAIADFLKTAKTRLNALGVRSTADIFGLVTTVNGPLEVAQHWERLSPVTDVLLPMVYPSHYPRGAFGLPAPNAEPYKVIFAAINRARERDLKLGVKTPEHVRPWLQAFTLGQPRYEAEQIREQKRAVYDAGYEGWVLWHPGSQYDVFVPGLEKETVSRRKAPGAAAPAAPTPAATPPAPR